MKKYIVLLVLGIVVLGGVLLITQSDEIIKASVEEYGPEITGGPVKLGSANISFFGGGLSLKDLVIGNPKGFTSPNAFTLDEVSVQMDLSSIGSDAIHIESILIDAPVITYELSGGRSNIAALERNMGLANSDSSDSASADIAVIIDDLVIRGARLNLVVELAGERAASVTLPDIHLQQIGTADDAVGMTEAATIVMAALTKEITKAVASDQIQNLLGATIGDKDEIIDKIGSKLKGLFGRD